MGEQIQFPKNFERFIEKAHEALDEGDFEQAVEYLEKAYEIDRDFELNFLLSTTYYDMGEEKRALYVANEFKNDYLREFEFFSYYVEVLVQNLEFIEAYRLIHQQIFQKGKSDLEKLTDLKGYVESSESSYKQYEKRRIEGIKKDISLIAKEAPFMQLSKINIADQLPLEDFIEVAKDLLLNPNIAVLVKSGLLEKLVTSKVEEEISFLWWNKELKKAIPAKLKLPDETESYQEVLEILNEEIGQDDPILQKALVDEIKLFYAIVFPFAEEVIEEPFKWVQSLVAQFSDSYKEQLSEERLEQLEKIKNLRLEVQEAAYT